MDHNHLLENLPDIMTVSQVQDTLKIGRTMAYRLLMRGEIKSVRIGKSYRIPKQYLMDYVREKTSSSMECQEEMK